MADHLKLLSINIYYFTAGVQPGRGGGIYRSDIASFQSIKFVLK